MVATSVATKVPTAIDVIVAVIVVVVAHLVAWLVTSYPHVATQVVAVSTAAVTPTIVHVAMVWDDSAAGLGAQMFRNRVIDVAKLRIAVRILAILIPLTVALVFKVATLLCFEALVHRPKFYCALWLLHGLLGGSTHLHHGLLGDTPLSGATHDLRYILDI